MDIIRCSVCKACHEKPILPFIERLYTLLNDQQLMNDATVELRQRHDMTLAEKMAQNETLNFLKTAIQSVFHRKKLYLKKKEFKETVFYMPMALHQADKIPNGDRFFMADELFELMNLSNWLLGVGNFSQVMLALTGANLMYFNEKGRFPESRTDYFELYKTLVPMLMDNLIHSQSPFFRLERAQKQRAEIVKRLCYSRSLNRNGEHQQEASDSGHVGHVEELNNRLRKSLNQQIETVKLSDLNWSQHVSQYFEEDSNRGYVVLCIVSDGPNDPSDAYYPVVILVSKEDNKSKVYFRHGGYMEFDTEQGEQQVLSVLNDMLEPLPSIVFEKMIKSYQEEVEDRIGVQSNDYMVKFASGSMVIGGIIMGTMAIGIPMLNDALSRAWSGW
ncbi:hypothetical protein [Candidatus Sororendozoicomonas aggregata]|uniref:hypothetical protein n=1 Tax=Candidatus Sororendozoicomonas aggregata TaxID=3073239 RepID=UPI002ECFC444